MQKAGFDPSQPRGADGRWSETGSGTAYPFSPGSKENIARASLAEAHANFKGMENNFDDVAIEGAIRRIKAATEEVSRLRTQRARDFESKTGQKAPSQPGTRAQTTSSSTASSGDVALDVLNNMRQQDNLSAAQAAQRRREEASRLSQQGQEQRRSQRTFEERMAGTGQSRYYSGQQQRTGERQQRAGLSGAVADTAERIARATSQIANLSANISGIAGTSDYAIMGRHLNFIRDDITTMRRELAGLPSDARRLRAEAKTAIARLNNQLSAFRTAVARRVG